MVFSSMMDKALKALIRAKGLNYQLDYNPYEESKASISFIAKGVEKELVRVHFNISYTDEVLKVVLGIGDNACVGTVTYKIADCSEDKRVFMVVDTLDALLARHACVKTISEWGTEIPVEQLIDTTSIASKDTKRTLYFSTDQLYLIVCRESTENETFEIGVDINPNNLSDCYVMLTSVMYDILNEKAKKLNGHAEDLLEEIKKLKTDLRSKAQRDVEKRAKEEFLDTASFSKESQMMGLFVQ